MFVTESSICTTSLLNASIEESVLQCPFISYSIQEQEFMRGIREEPPRKFTFEETVQTNFPKLSSVLVSSLNIGSPLPADLCNAVWSFMTPRMSHYMETAVRPGEIQVLTRTPVLYPLPVAIIQMHGKTYFKHRTNAHEFESMKALKALKLVGKLMSEFVDAMDNSQLSRTSISTSRTGVTSFSLLGVKLGRT
jgi:hypothetical protein